MTKDEKLALAITLRDAALIVVKRAGSRHSVSRISGKCLLARVGSISIGYRTPFQRLPAPAIGDDLKYLAASLGKGPPPVNLPYGLDIWSTKKVLNIEWDDHGNVVLVSLRRGEWETELTTVSEDAH